MSVLLLPLSTRAFVAQLSDAQSVKEARRLYGEMLDCMSDSTDFPISHAPLAPGPVAPECAETVRAMVYVLTVARMLVKGSRVPLELTLSDFFCMSRNDASSLLMHADSAADTSARVCTMVVDVIRNEVLAELGLNDCVETLVRAHWRPRGHKERAYIDLIQRIGRSATLAARTMGFTAKMLPPEWVERCATPALARNSPYPLMIHVVAAVLANVFRQSASRCAVQRHDVVQSMIAFFGGCSANLRRFVYAYYIHETPKRPRESNSTLDRSTKVARLTLHCDSATTTTSIDECTPSISDEGGEYFFDEFAFFYVAY
jgi:hypothetical protein